MGEFTAFPGEVLSRPKASIDAGQALCESSLNNGGHPAAVEQARRTHCRFTASRQVRLASSLVLGAYGGAA